MIARDLLRWYRRNRRALPWRRTRDPYRIWVSEVMLQQTRVSTVIPYYRRFLRLFPDVRVLARAPLGRVLKAWQGLGYYARARNLRAAAALVAADSWPHTAAEWRRLPGVGPSTAAAVAAIAFGERELSWEANARRVVARLLGREGTMPSGWMTRSAPGDFNQALMELGQTICTPRSPSCPRCPLVKSCVAAASGAADRIPVRRRARKIPHFSIGVGILWDRGRVLVQPRPLSGMLGGLWEFPGGKQRRGETAAQCVVREVREETGLEVVAGPSIATVRHRYSHLAVTLHALLCRPVGGRHSASRARWVGMESLGRLPFPAANWKIILRLRELHRRSKTERISIWGVCGQKSYPRKNTTRKEGRRARSRASERGEQET